MIAVINVKDEDVIIASVGWSNKFASEVSVNLAHQFKHGSIAMVEAATIQQCWQEGIFIWGIGEGCRAE